MQKNKIATFHIIYKINSRWVECKKQNYNTTRRKHGRGELLDIDLGNAFYGYDTKIIDNKGKNKVELHQTKLLYRKKRKPME